MKLENSKILVVDDTPQNLKILMEILSDEGFEIFVASNGKEALASTNYNMPDIVLLDVMMPEMDGFECAKLLKKSEKTCEIPIIFMTALSDTADKLKGFEVGGVDYITKPIQNQEVLARVKTHLTVLHQKRALEKQKAELRLLNATKDKFFSIIAHDLKNALGGLLLTSDLLDSYFDKLAPAQMKDRISRIKQGAERLNRLLGNLLEWARTHTGTIQFNPEPIDLYVKGEEAISILKLNANSKDITLSSAILPNTIVFADNYMITSVIRNLLSNAIKFTSRGGKIEIKSENKDDFVEISIADTGIGISADDMNKLFRIDVHHTTIGTGEETGTGLGLILCKDFVEKNGGKIWVESEFGKGSTFFFTMRCHEASVKQVADL